MSSFNNLLIILIACSLPALGVANGPPQFNYDEAKVPTYRLPDPLRTQSGDVVDSPETWTKIRRGEILELFRTHVYGRAPAACPIRPALVSMRDDALDGIAVRREVDVFFGTSPDAPSMRLLIYTPKSSDHPVPAFIGLNFHGNHTVDPDRSISLPDAWVRAREGLTNGNRASDAGRGTSSSRWPARMVVQRGFALVTIYYGDIDPDFDDGFENGIHAALQKNVEKLPAGERWGSIATWAYGLSRALDYLQTDALIDATRVAVVGHSRLGKTSLWTGASDPRFALVISNDSGCGGAALSRRRFGETVARINTVFPHWFCDNFLQYNDNEEALPVDQHQLVALMAPRPVYVASATLDRWADPNGEFLSALHADPVYRLLGTDGMGSQSPPEKMPAPDMPINNGHIGYHLRTGKHDITEYDWQQYLDFAARHFK